jgi:predicted secreted protein
MRRALLTLALLAPGLLPFGAALAQPAGETRLRLGATGEVQVVPDELAARLRVEARGGTPAAAQAEVNRRMAAALATARAVEGVRADTAGYWTYTDPQSREAVARQGLVLRAGSGERALPLVARLQAEGLQVESLGWRLSDGAARAAHDAAVAAAIRSLRERAEAIARELGLRVVALQQLTVDAVPEMRAAPAPMAAMAARATAEPPPAVTAEPMPVAATVTGDLLLRP